MRIRLYVSDGIDSVNVVSNLNIIINNAEKVYDRDNLNLIQIEGLTEIIVDEITVSVARKVSYIILTDDNRKVGYNITNYYEFIAPNTCKFYVTEDAIATALQNIEIIEASADRMSVSVEDDNNYYYTELEPFKPSQVLHILNVYFDEPFTNGCTENTNIAETIVIPPRLYKYDSSGIENAPIPNSDYKLSNNFVAPQGLPTSMQKVYMDNLQTLPTANVIKDSENNVISVSTLSIGEVVYRKMVSSVMQIKSLITDTIINVALGSRWWREQDLNSVDQTGVLEKSTVINDLRRVGSDHNVTAYWSIPTPYIESVNSSQYNPLVDSNYGGIVTIVARKYKGVHWFENSARVKNNKAKYSQWVSITVFNPVSGEKYTKQPWEVMNPTNTPNNDRINCDYVICADLRPNGAPIFAFKYKNREEQKYGIPESIKGGEWRKIPLVGEGARGDFMQQALLNREKERTPYKAIIDGMGEAISKSTSLIGAGAVAGTAITPGVGTAIGAGVGLVTGIASYLANNQTIKDQQEILDTQGAIADSELTLSPSNYHREIGMNSFYGIFNYYSNEDQLAFDRFLTLYGYKVNNKKFTYDDLRSRPHFNYVKLNSITLRSDIWSQYTLDLLKQQLKMGVRIWHELPNEEAITNGNR